MKRVTLPLAASTVGLALLSGYLWNQLDAERRRSQVAAQQQTELRTRLVKLERAPAPVVTDRAPATPATVAQTKPAAAPADAPSQDQLDAEALQQIKWQKRQQDAHQKMLDDPAGRELILAQARSEARAENRDLARELHLTNEEYERVIDLLAQYELQQRDLFNRRAGGRNVTADVVNEMQALRARQAQDIADVLGYDKAQLYAAYADSRAERTQVRRLRGMLDERDALSDEQSARLVAALYNERQAFNKDLERRIPNERINGSMGTWYGGQFRSDGASNVAAQEQMLTQIEEYSQRMRRSAGSVLSATQLRAFAQMQDQRLAQHRLEMRTQVAAEESN